MNPQLFLSWISSDNGLVVHIAIFCALVLGGIGFPIPEDIPIILGGVAAAKGIVWPQPMWLTCYVGVLIADQFVYWIGYFWGNRLLQAGKHSRLFPAITQKKIDEVREGLRRRRLAIIFVSRHLFPVRSVTFLTAGALHIPFFEFLFADSIAALVSVSIVLSLGFFLGEKLTPEVISHLLRDAHLYICGLLVLITIWWFIRRSLRRKRTLSVALENISANSAEKGQESIS